MRSFVPSFLPPPLVWSSFLIHHFLWHSSLAPVPSILLRLQQVLSVDGGARRRPIRRIVRRKIASSDSSEPLVVANPLLDSTILDLKWNAVDIHDLDRFYCRGSSFSSSLIETIASSSADPSVIFTSSCFVQPRGASLSHRLTALSCFCSKFGTGQQKTRRFEAK